MTRMHRACSVLPLLVSAVGLLLCPASDAQAVTLTGPVAAGDIFSGHQFGDYLHQTRGNTLVTSLDMTNLGGVTTDLQSNLWIAHGDGNVGTELKIEMIPFAQDTSTVKLDGATLNAPGTATDIRDIVFDSTGNLFALFKTTSDATVMKYAPNGSGGFQTGTTLGSFAGQSFGDYGAGRLDLSADEQFLVTGDWSLKRLHSMNTATGVVVSQNPGANTSGGAQIDPSRPNVVAFSTNTGLAQTSFDPVTGAIGSSSTELTTAASMVDGTLFVPELDRLYFMSRGGGGQIRYATGDQLEAAAAGSPFAIADLPLVYQGSAANTTRDLAMITPPHLDSPIEQGDLFAVDANLRYVNQIRDGSKVGTLDFGANTAIGGVSSDNMGNLYVAGDAFGVYGVSLGESQPRWLVRPEELASGLSVRDCVTAADGTVYVGYSGGQIDQFTPDGDGYTRTTLGNSTVTGTDYGNMHIWLTENENYLLTSGRGDNDIVAIDTGDGSTTIWHSPRTLVGEIALDPIDENYIVFGTGISGTDTDLRGISFDQDTGTFGAVDVLNTDTDDWVDALTFDPASGVLYMSVRSSQLRMATYSQYLAARAGTLLDIDQLPLAYSGGEVNVARDMAVVNIPEPGTLLLVLLGALSLLLVRRR